MRSNFFSLGRVFLAALLVAVVAVATVPELQHVLHLGAALHAGVALASVPLVIPMDIRSQSYASLQAETKPVDTNLPEALPDVLYDTQQYPQAGTAQLQFFAAVNADKSLSNMEQAGTLPAPQFFKVFRIFVELLGAPTATIADTAAGVINDAEIIAKVARARLTYVSKNKSLGPIPITYFGTPGGNEGIIGSGRAGAAGAVVQALTGNLNGGFPVNGAITLRSQSSFSIVMDCVPAQAISVATQIRVSLLGIRFREVG